MKKFLSYFIPICLCLGVGWIGKEFQADSLLVWYPSLHKSPLTPPGIVFSLAWLVLYILMAVSLGAVLRSRGSGKTTAVFLFIVQLLFNLTWSIVFFTLRHIAGGFCNLIVLDFVVFSYMRACHTFCCRAVWLFVPYAAWLLFATYLNGYLLLYN